MTLDYKILWFEDNQTSFTTKSRQLKSVVEELGFVFAEPRNEVDGENLETIDFTIYDLIIADLNLAHDVKGSSILDQIRAKDIYTEVVFYSSEGEDYVRAELLKYKIDGAYCAHRDNDEFIEKVSQVILTTIKKVQDLNNMRGLIMSETSDIEKTMKKIIKLSLEKNAFGLRESLKQTIFENVQIKVNSKKSKFDTASSNDNINQIISDNVMFDASEKIKAVQQLIDLIDHEVTYPHKGNQFKGSYSEITRKRNLLGHETPDIIEGKTIIGKDDSAFEFNDYFCKNIRQMVKTHGTDLDQLLNLIEQQP